MAEKPAFCKRYKLYIFSLESFDDHPLYFGRFLKGEGINKTRQKGLQINSSPMLTLAALASVYLLLLLAREQSGCHHQ